MMKRYLNVQEADSIMTQILFTQNVCFIESVSK